MELANSISMIMPKVARWIVCGFFQTVDVPPTQIFAIMTLQEKGQCRFSELSKALHIAAPTVTGIVDRLQAAQYVKRSNDPLDRRVVNVTLTPKGLRLAKKLRGVIRDRWCIILSKLSKQDREIYLRILCDIQQYIEETPQTKNN